MQLTGKLIQVMPVQTGTGKNGQWKKQEIILETEGNYPKKVCVAIWGDKINESQLKQGAMLKVSFVIVSMEYNWMWYSYVKAWKVENATAGAGNSTAPDFPEGDVGESMDDLPF